MEKIRIRFIMIASLVLALAACEDEGGDTDTRLTAVNALIEPLDGKELVLEPSAGASAYFEWEYCKVEESGTAVYQIAFDKADGDFSNPVYVTAAGNNGLYNNVTITHKQLNKIAGMTGINSAETGSLKWTVYSSKGLNAMKGKEERTITITRLAGFDELPIEVSVTGAGSEGGDDPSKAQKMNATAVGVFDVYTRLTANQPFSFMEGASAEPRAFYTDNSIIKVGGTSTVPETGVYRITLDFVTGAGTYTLISRIGFYFCPEGKILFDLPYVGNGVFRAENQTVTFKQEGWGRDERYKFRMFVRENAGTDPEKELEWGTLNGTDSRPTATSPASYYYLRLITDLTQWDNKWKLMGDFDGVPADYTIYLQADQPYTHTISK
jgi:hypothetical protein